MTRTGSRKSYSSEDQLNAIRVEHVSRWRLPITAAVFLAFLVLGLMIYDDYGVHWDEYPNQKFGEKWVRYVQKSYEVGYPLKLEFEKRKVFRNFDFEIVPHSDPLAIKAGEHDTSHGPVFEMLLALMSNKILHLSDSRQVILMRHLSIFILFYLSTIVFYFLAVKIYNNWKIGLLGLFFLVLHPRILSHAFYNTVDIAFLSFYILSAYSLILFVDKKSYSTACFHALSCALLIGVRSAGLLVPLCTVIIFGLDFLMGNNKKKIVGTLGVYLALLSLFAIAFWPYLWSDPYHNFLRAINHSTFSFSQKYTCAHEHIHKWSTGWPYNFKWIFLTTPIIYTLLFSIGFFSSIVSLIKNSIEFYAAFKKYVIVLLLFIAPLIAPIVLKSYLYDGWRHHYFVYPMFVLICLMGVTKIFHFLKEASWGTGSVLTSWFLVLVVAINFFYVSIYIARTFPHENVYSIFPTHTDKHRVKAKGAIDYWGLSYRHLYEYLIENDNSEKIEVGFHNYGARNNLEILSERNRKKFKLISLEEEMASLPQYLITNYRTPDDRFEIFKDLLASNRYDEYYSLVISGDKIAGIYKLK